MHKLAYKWLDTHHVAPHQARRCSRDRPSACAFTVTSVTDSDGVRDVHGTFQVPLFLGDTTAFSGMVTDVPATRRSTATQTWTANFICVLPSTVQSARTGDADALRARSARRRGRGRGRLVLAPACRTT